MPIVFEAGDIVDATDLTLITAGGALIPTEHLLQVAPRIFLQLGAFLNRGTANVLELVPLLQYDDTRPEYFRPGGVSQAADGWKKFLGPPVEITAFVKQMPLLVLRVAARVDQGTGQLAAPTFLLLGQT